MRLARRLSCPRPSRRAAKLAAYGSGRSSSTLSRRPMSNAMSAAAAHMSGPARRGSSPSRTSTGSRPPLSYSSISAYSSGASSSRCTPGPGRGRGTAASKGEGLGASSFSRARAGEGGEAFEGGPSAVGLSSAAARAWQFKQTRASWTALEGMISPKGAASAAFPQRSQAPGAPPVTTAPPLVHRAPRLPRGRLHLLGRSARRRSSPADSYGAHYEGGAHGPGEPRRRGAGPQAAARTCGPTAWLLRHTRTGRP